MLFFTKINSWICFLLESSLFFVFVQHEMQSYLSFFSSRLSVTCIDNFTELSFWRQSAETLAFRPLLYDGAFLWFVECRRNVELSIWSSFLSYLHFLSEAAVVFGKISHEDYTYIRERDSLFSSTRKSPTVRIKINFSANAKCQRRAKGEEKNLRLFLTIAARRRMIILL